MRKKEEKATDTLEREELNAFLGSETSFEGTLSYTGAVRLDGRFKGEIRSDDVLIVGETGKIEGEINVGIAIIQGEVVGNINTKEKMELQHPGKVIGNIISPAIVIDDGAVFDGTCKMKEKKKEEKATGIFARKKEGELKTEDVKKEPHH